MSIPNFEKGEQHEEPEMELVSMPGEMMCEACGTVVESLVRVRLDGGHVLRVCRECWTTVDDLDEEFREYAIEENAPIGRGPGPDTACSRECA